MDKRVYESNKMLIVRTQQCDKLVFVDLLQVSCHCETSVRTGLAMTALFFKHQFVLLMKCRYRKAQASQPQMAPGETLLRA